MIDLWHLTNIDWLNCLPDQTTESLRQAALLESYPPGAQVFGPAAHPDHVYILETGLIRIFRESDQAEEVTFGFVRPGEVFGECGLFDNYPRESHAVTAEPSVTLKLPQSVFMAAMQSNPSIVYALAKQIDGRFRDIETRVEDLVFRNARGRLAHTFLQLAKKFGRAEQGRITLQIKFSQKELATLIGTSRPTVSIAMGELEAEGLISRHGGLITINHPAALEGIINTR